MSEKIFYNPSEEKRFEVSKDEYSRERIGVLRELNKEFKELPANVGLVLFGSLSKGKKLNKDSKKYTDIDIQVFIDMDDLANNETAVKDFINNNQVALDRYNLEKSEQISERYFQALGDYIRSRIIYQYKKNGIDGEFLYINISKIASKGNYSIYNKLNHYLSALYEENQYEEDAWKQSIQACFGLNIGNNLKKYRQSFIEDLASLNTKDRNLDWDLVKKAVNEWERNDNVPINMKNKFPDTFEDAQKYYLEKNKDD